MERVTFVTSNQNKLREARTILPFEIESEKLNLTEIQSLDIKKVVRHKLLEAYGKLHKPVMVEDVFPPDLRHSMVYQELLLNSLNMAKTMKMAIKSLKA